FHDGSEMETADLLYPYALAFRWGGEKGEAGASDPDIAAATRLIRERLKGIRIVRVEEKSLQLADLTFSYRIPIVEVYLDDLSSDPEETALLERLLLDRKSTRLNSSHQNIAYSVLLLKKKDETE